MKRRGLLIGALFALAACATTPATAPPPGEFSSDRISVVVQGGSGPDVILIPGLSSSRDVWNTTADALDDHYRVHLVQLNGFAGAPVGANGDGPVSAPVAEEIARYIGENHLDHPAVIGHSMGGSIGMMLAARHPEAVGKLMVVDMFPFMGAMFGGPGATAESVTPIADQIRGAMRMAPQGVVSDQTRGMITSMVRTESARPEIIEHARLSNVATTANAFHELIVTDLRPELSKITAPTEVLYVKFNDPRMTPQITDSIYRMSFANLPGVQLKRIDDSAHFIMFDQPQAFYADLDAFLAK